ncbi:MAG: glycosyltransferase family protein [Crocinitomicaceae bacterium]|nr:glycosyltransferase family protein [Crocinitomicaceae bacterium]
MRTVVFIQARMGSTRLPGKVLKDICGKPQIDQLLSRLKGGKEFSERVVVTSDLAVDDILAEHCRQSNVPVFRGSEWDVLDRFFHCGIHLGLQPKDRVVRVTADCPLHHFDVVDFALRCFNDHQLDYFSNSFAPLYEDGCDTEVFTFETLTRAADNAHLLSQREHVTPYIKDSGIFFTGYKKYSALYNYKLSVDTENDLTVVRSIFQHLKGNPQFSIHDVVDLLIKTPHLLIPNSDSRINEGYARSLKEDRPVK